MTSIACLLFYVNTSGHMTTRFFIMTLCCPLRGRQVGPGIRSGQSLCLATVRNVYSLVYIATRVFRLPGMHTFLLSRAKPLHGLLIREVAKVIVKVANEVCVTMVRSLLQILVLVFLLVVCLILKGFYV